MHDEAQKLCFSQNLSCSEDEASGCAVATRQVSLSLSLTLPLSTNYAQHSTRNWAPLQTSFVARTRHT